MYLANSEEGKIRTDPILPWIEETTPITEWYTISSSNGSPLRRVQFTWYENRNNFEDFNKPMPLGWTRHEIFPDDLGILIQTDVISSYLNIFIDQKDIASLGTIHSRCQKHEKPPQHLCRANVLSLLQDKKGTSLGLLERG